MWEFPQDTHTRLCIGPTYRPYRFAGVTIYNDWDPRLLNGDGYRNHPAIGTFISEESLTQFLADCNAVLKDSLPVMSLESMMSRIVTQAQIKNTPQLTWQLHCHRYAAELAGSAIMEHMYFTVDIVINQVEKQTQNPRPEHDAQPTDFGILEDLEDNIKPFQR
jgi:hypothetical protein